MDKATLATYIWIDADGNPRSKVKVLTEKVNSVADLAIWNFDGSSTKQAEGKFSDVYLYPQRIYKDPFNGEDHIMVLCECWDDEVTPNKFNSRKNLRELCERHENLEPLCGIEQEYILFDRVSNLPFGWKGFNEPGSGPQGPYYCGAGGHYAYGRKIAEKHLDLCILAGVGIFGINGEVMPAQWEFQVGTCDPLKTADDLMIARYILARITEDFNAYVSFHPKPYLGDWNGSGAHTNFSTKLMREDGGIVHIENACRKFEGRQHEVIKLYGEGNELRLTGHHETQSIDKFSWGIGDRGASIRIPKQVKRDGKGYFEDRRPASNCDPYVVLHTILKIITE